MCLLQLYKEVQAKDRSTLLNVIVNYLEMAPENPLDDSTRPTLSLSHSASKPSVYVIDGLLYLTGTTKEPTPLIAEAFDIRAGLHESFRTLRQRAIRKSIGFEFIEYSNFPRFVRGDLQQLQQIVLSLVLNAFQSTLEGVITIHLKGEPATEKDCVVQISVEDSRIGMLERGFDDLCQEYQQVTDGETHKDKTPLSSEESITDRSDMPFKLGLSLALVARFVKNTSGQIRVR